MFYPVLLTLTIFIIFLWPLKSIMRPFLNRESIFSIKSCFQLESIYYSSDFNSKLLFIIPIIIALFLFQAFVIFTSLYTVKFRKIWDNRSKYNVSMTKYCFVSSFFTIVALFGYFTTFDNNVSAFSPLLSSVERGHEIPHFCTIEILRLLLEVMAVATVSLLFCAVHSLVPTLVWDGTEGSLCRAKEQLLYMSRWLKVYFDVAILYFMCAGAFQFAYVGWLSSNLRHEQANSYEIGVMFFNSALYVFLLVMTLLPVGIRMQIAISYVEDRETKGVDISQKVRWRAQNGFPDFGFLSGLKYYVALISPFLFPALSLILEI